MLWWLQKIKIEKKEFDQVGLFIISYTTIAHPITTISQKKGLGAKLNQSRKRHGFQCHTYPIKSLPYPAEPQGEKNLMLPLPTE